MTEGLKKEFLTERQGKTVVLYAGLLDLAHQKGVKSIRTELLQSPSEANNFTAICSAIVEMPEGKIFTGIGDANLANVGKMIAVHIIRMSETRAKARALRDALNIGAVALEELGEEDSAPQANTSQNRATKPAQSANTPPLSVVQGGAEPEELTPWEKLKLRAEEFGFISDDSHDYVFLTAELCKGVDIKGDERYLYAAGEQELAWNAAIEALKAKKQQNSQKAVAQ